MSQAQVQYLTIDPKLAGQRIDNFLLGYFKSVPRTRIYKALRKGEVRVNRRRIKATYRIQSGDEVRLPPLHVQHHTQDYTPARSQIEQVEASILYEDAELLVFNKPANHAVHSGSGIRAGIIECIRASRAAGEYLELAHRLDRPTSGCLLVAKSRRQLMEIQDSFKNNSVTKSYLGLVKGNWKAHSTVVDYRLCSQSNAGMQKMMVTDSGKEAVSRFTQIRRLGPCSLMRVDIDTGRTHQIRVHASAMGYPLAGDDRYGDHGFNRECKGWGLHRLFLHAEQIEFKTADGQARRFQCPMPEDLLEVLDFLQNHFITGT